SSMHGLRKCCVYEPSRRWSWLSLFFSSRRRHTRSKRDWSSDVCSSDLSLFRERLFYFVLNKDNLGGMDMQEQLKILKSEAIEKIKATDSLDVLQEIQVEYTGRKGSITTVLRGMGKLSAEERRVVGQLANEVREAIQTELANKKASLEQIELDKQLAEETIDVTLPGRKINVGSPHILTSVIEEIEDLFIGLGYEIKEGPEVETDFYNFEALNLPKGHPAREMQDSFYITNELLLRTHTS